MLRPYLQLGFKSQPCHILAVVRDFDKAAVIPTAVVNVFTVSLTDIWNHQGDTLAVCVWWSRWVGVGRWVCMSRELELRKKRPIFNMSGTVSFAEVLD